MVREPIISLGLTAPPNSVQTAKDVAVYDVSFAALKERSLTCRRNLMKIPLTSDQKAQLVGFLNYEHDHGIAIRSIARQAIIPGATGTLELISRDYEWLVRVRETVKSARERDPDLSTDDLDTLEDVARANIYRDREDFWNSIIDSIGRARNGSANSSEVL